jgi:hypothetical protein
VDRRSPLTDLVRVRAFICIPVDTSATATRAKTPPSPELNNNRPVTSASQLPCFSSTSSSSEKARARAAAMNKSVSDCAGWGRLCFSSAERHDSRRCPHQSKLSAVLHSRLIKIADKISNVRSVAASPPVDWSNQRRRDYMEFCTAVVNECRGTSPILEAEFDAAKELALLVIDRVVPLDGSQFDN